MEIKAKGKLDFASVKALTHSVSYRKIKPKTSFVLTSVFCGVTVLFTFVMLFAFSDGSAMHLAIMAVALFLLSIYMYFLLPKITYNALANLKDAENEFVFTNDSLKITTKSEKYTGESEIEYSVFVKVCETSEYLCLYETKNRAFVIDKSTIEDGTIEEIRCKLKEFVKKKYVISNY